MLEWLILCLPRKYSDNEVNFHRQRCLRKYRHFVDLFNAGVCDHGEIDATWHGLIAYSLSVLKRQDHKVYKSLSETNSRLKRFKSPEGLPGLVSRP